MNEPEEMRAIEKKSRFKQIGTSHLFLVKDGKLLMLRRYNTGYEDGSYSVIAGHIDEGETARETMVREAREEAGIDIDVESLDVAHVMHRTEDDTRIDFFFTAEKWKGEPVNIEPEKCDDMRWVDMDELPDNTVPYIRDAVDCFKNKTLYSEHGWG